MDDEIEFIGMNLVPAGAHPSRTGPRARRRKGVRTRPEDVVEVSDDEYELPPGIPPPNPRAAGPSHPLGPFGGLLFHPDALHTPTPPPGPSNALAGGRRASSSASAPSASRAPSSVATPPPGASMSIDRYVAQVLEIVPDVDPDHLTTLLAKHIDSYKEKVVEPVLHILFENPNYPKVVKGKGKGKRKRDDSDNERPSKARVKIDYLSKNRVHIGSKFYVAAALAQLNDDFSFISKSYIKRTFFREGGFYAPTYFALEAERKSGKLPNQEKAPRNKGKGKEQAAFQDPDFEAERAWVVGKLYENAIHEDEVLAEKLNEQEYEQSGDGIECGCCFSTYPFDKMIQCPEAHLFCTECMSTYCETLLGAHDANVVCMDQSGCKLPFPESELRRFLSPKLLSLYDRVRQRKEIEAAGLENLEECPFCEYKVVIDNPEEKLFRCENAECGAVTCRGCKKPDHLPKSCQEMEEDKKLDARHVIEEAMTRALMRNCPKCTKAFVKETGCNKMICPNCRTISCYACRKIIAGYDHFDQTPGGPKPAKSNKCPLWDTVEQRHADEVTAAARKAMADYKREHPEVDDKDIRVELPKGPAAGPANPPAAPAVHHHAHHAHHAHPPHVVVHRHAQPPLVPAPHPHPHPHMLPPFPMVQLPGMHGVGGVQIGVLGGGMLPVVQQVAYPAAQGPGYQVNINFEPRQMPMLPPPPPPAHMHPAVMDPRHPYHRVPGPPPPVPPPRLPLFLPDVPEPQAGRRKAARRPRAKNGRR